MSTEFLSLADAKSRLSEVVKRVQTQHERVTVTVHGKPAAVLLAPDDLASLEETLAVLSDPDTMRQIAETDAQIARGEVEGEDELRAAMEQRFRRSAS
jgi:antitoxin YefM